MKLFVEHKLQNFQVVIYIIKVEWGDGQIQVKHRFRAIFEYYSWLMRKLPPYVRRSLPPFPAKKIFNKSIVTIERRRLGLERFLRALIRTNYIQKHMFLLRPIQLDSIEIKFSQDLPSPVLSPDLENKIKTLAQFEGTTESRLMIKSLPELNFTSPTVITSLRPGGHRNVIPTTLGDYDLHWKLADCLEPQTSLYFGSCNGRSVTVKIQHQENDVGTLKEQQAIHASLAAVIGVPQFIEYIEGEILSGIVLEALPSTSTLLSDLELPLSIESFITIALTLTETLETIHALNISYGALCPLTVWYDAEEAQVYFVDFCWCQVNNAVNNDADIEWSTILPSSLIPYIAPEHIRQSRVGNSGFRADLYSLGIILFELATGRLPFDCVEKDQLLHAHLAMKPHRADEINVDIPKIVGSIIDKLLQKEPVQRYATAHGVYSDLLLCKEYLSVGKEWNEPPSSQALQTKLIRDSLLPVSVKRREIPEFELGRQDITDNFTIPERIYERDDILRAISRSIYDVEHNGEREIVLLCGASGTGKTKLISNIVQRLYHDIWFSMTIEFSQETQPSLGENADLLQNLFARSGIQTQTIGHQILSRSKFEVDQWRDKITQIISDDGDLLLKYIPSLRDVVGPLGSRSHKNFDMPQARKITQLLCKFFTALAGPGHPLLLVLDSVQWANQQLLQLFFTLSSLPGISHIMFLLSFRTESPTVGNERLGSVLRFCEQRNMQMRKLTLENLSLPSIKAILEEAIGVAPSDSILPLAQMIERKTCGNPLFVTQFLRSLYQEKLLKFDDLQRKWMWDTDQIQKKPYTPNVIKFMIYEIDKLSAKQRELLYLGACIGNEFDIITLTRILNEVVNDPLYRTTSKMKSPKPRRPRTEYIARKKEDSTLDDILSRCLHIAEKDLLSVIIDRKDDISVKGFAFTHEQIHQAAYQSQSSKLAARIHLLIGEYWMEEFHKKNVALSAEETKSPPYRIVRQLNNGRAFLTNQKSLMKLVGYNLTLAQRAVEEEDPEQAVECASVAIEILARESEAKAWKLHHKIMMELNVILYAFQRCRDATELFTTLMNRARTKLEKVELYSAKLDHYRKQNLLSKAVDVAKICIKEILMVPLSDNPSLMELTHMHEELRNLWASEDVETVSESSVEAISQFNGAKYAEERKLLRQKIQRLLSRCIDLSVQSDPCTIIQLSIQSTQWSLQWGITENSLPGLIMYAVSCIHMFNDIPLAFRIEKLLIQLQDRFPQRQSLITQARLQWFHYWHNIPLSEGLHAMNCMEEELWESYRDTLSHGRTFYASHILGALACNSYFTSESLEECESLLTSCAEYCQSTSSAGDVIVHSILLAIENLRKTEHPEESATASISDLSAYSLKGASIQAQALHYCTQMPSHYILGAVSQSHKAMQFIQSHLDALFGRVEQFYFRFWSCLILCSSIETFRRIHCAAPESSTPDLKSTINDSKTVVEYLSQIDVHVKEMISWGETSPVNFGHCVDLVSAEQLRISGLYQEACDKYRVAIAGARSNKYIVHEAVAHEQLGRLMILMGKKSPARYCILDAIRCFRDWGATNKVVKLETHFKSLLSIQLNPSSIVTSNNQQGDKGSVSKEAKRMENQLKLLHMISKELQMGIGLGSSLRRCWTEICVHTGAERGCLALFRKRQLYAEITNVDGNIKVLQSTTITNQSYCVSIMNYVTTSKTSVIVEDCLNDTTFLGDPYVRERKIRSLCCTPVFIHNTIIGVLYLENSLISGLFTEATTSVLSTIALQLTLAITNEQLSCSLARQVAENRINPLSVIPGTNQFKALVFRRVDHLLGYSWEKCTLLLTENHLLIHEPEATNNSQSLARYAVDGIQQVNQVPINEIIELSTPPSRFILRIFLNNRKLKLFFAMEDLQSVQQWIAKISSTIKQQPAIHHGHGSDSLDQTIKLWEDEVELGAIIGRGATSKIFTATWHGMRVAVKQFLNHDVQDTETESEFNKEVRILQNLRHPSIILFIGAYFTSDGPCVVTELMKFDLSTYLKKEKMINMETKARWAMEITNAMVYLHSFTPPIVHRDLKSMNILLDDNLRAKVADLGLARFCDRNMTDQLGTPAWMAPEVFSGGEFTTAADVYSFGIILWEIYTGQQPFTQFTFSVEIGNQVVKGLRPTIPDVCPFHWKELMELCWAHEVESRPSFQQVLHYLQSNFLSIDVIARE